MILDNIPPELGNALKIVREYADRISAGKGEDPNIVFTQLLNSEDQRVPLNWNGTCHYTYYKEDCALLIKKYLDQAETEGKNILVENKPFGISRNTLVQQFYQGALYLVERLDPNGKYKLLRTRLEFQKHKEGVMVYWKYKMPIKTEALSYDGIPVDIDAGPKIKEELIDFLENGKDETKFQKSGLALSQEHQDYIKDLCSGISNIIPLVVNSNRIIIVKSSFAASAIKEKA